ncbi:DUF1302 domain-containing protein [Halopseudomonas aestusnigri]|jgi:hypothetical protein|uniref:DUF1302 domain-containing protein n=1 Tax=Halopseudomonas aestusnigri TaxID=857252 RepID=UPI000C8CA4C3|nr:adhesin [Pseudomonadales bacterium]|tara:strand:+ start:1324 stop:3252 length:1929 start_codon:yes stop_codon:yes gene_type:complete
MTKKMHCWSLAALPLAIGMATFSGAANAVAFNIGEVEAQLDSQLSVGVSMSTQGADKRFVSMSNGGEAAARTSDDGRLNYEAGDVFSKIFRGVHDLELRYGDSGAFFRGKYWYDFETKDGSQRFYDIDDSGRSPLTKAAGVALLDAFVYHNYFIGNNPGNVRLGRQVVSWGESTFIQNSINSINPIDVAALRRPGAEVKEGLLPVEMLYLSQGLTENLSMEAFYQLKWAPFALDNCGTFFGADTLATGCVDRLVVGGVDLPQGDSGLVVDSPYAPFGASSYIVRARKDKEARDDGQFGVAFRYFAPELNDSEFGFYFMNYHSRAPYYSNVAGRLAGPAGLVSSGNLPNTIYQIPGMIDTVTGINGVEGPAGYFFEYPEDIRLYGVSFQTMAGSASVSGELSYRPNMPMQINTGDMSRTALVTAGVPVPGVGVIAVPGSDNTHRGLAGTLEPGDYIPGYQRKEFYQAQVTVVNFIDRVMGASRLALVGEAGVNYIGGLGDVKFGRDSLFGQSPYVDGDGATSGAGSCASNQGTAAPDRSPNAASWCESDGFYTDWSWGYRVRASLEYSNVFAGINLSPNLTWSHDVEGYGPNFTEDAKAISIGLNADYGNKYNASISYTDFFDGKYNTAVDRDFASVSFSVSF